MDSVNPDLQADLLLLARFRAGNPAACKQVSAWASEIVRIRRFFVPRSDQEDLVQETLVMVWRAVTAEDFVLRENFRALVRKVAAARCVDRIRRLRPMTLLDNSLPDGKDGPLEHAENESERIRLRWILETLSPSCRQIIEMHYFERLSYAEIAERLGRSESTMRVRMFNCMKSIRAMLDRTAARPG